MKELFVKILENYGGKMIPFFIGLLCMFVILFLSDIIKGEIKKKTLTEEMVKPNAVVSTKKSKNFLECIYDQLECYNKNAGLSREIIIEACKEIDYCDHR